MPILSCRLEDKGIHPDQEFQQLLKHRLFKDALEHGNASLMHLETIYVERQHTLYKVRQPTSAAWTPPFNFCRIVDFKNPHCHDVKCWSVLRGMWTSVANKPQNLMHGH